MFCFSNKHEKMLILFHVEEKTAKIILTHYGKMIILFHIAENSRLNAG